MLLLKLFLVPIFIGLIAASGRRWGASVAGLLSGLPVIAGPIVWFIYLENGFEFAQYAASATVSGVTALSSFCFSYAWFCTRLEWKASLILSCTVYFVIAWLVGSLAMGLEKSALIACIVVLLQLYLSPNQENKPLLAPASPVEILCRMLFAFLLVFSITGFAESLGRTYSGIFSAFPIAGSTIAMFSHRNYSAAHAIRSLKSMKQGLLSMLAFFYVVATISDELGFSVALLFAALVALLLQGVILLVKNYSFR